MTGPYAADKLPRVVVHDPSRIVQLTYRDRNALDNGRYERRDEGLGNFGLTISQVERRVICRTSQSAHLAGRR